MQTQDMNFEPDIWTNPTDKDVVMNLHVAPGQRARFVVKAKSSASIPREFRGGIHQIVNGQVVGGEGPQLVREGPQAPKHPMLDVIIEEAQAKPAPAPTSAKKA